MITVPNTEEQQHVHSDDSDPNLVQKIEDTISTWFKDPSLRYIDQSTELWSAYNAYDVDLDLDSWVPYQLWITDHRQSVIIDGVTYPLI